MFRFTLKLSTYVVLASALASALAWSAAHAATYLTVPLPDGCVPTLSGTTVTCSGTPPPVVEVCPPNTTGTPPHCTPIPPPVTASCEGFANAIRLTMNWDNPVPLYTGGMGPLDVAIVQFTTGPYENPAGYGNITSAEYQSQPSQRTGVLSDQPCSFVPLNAGAASTSNTTTVSFSVGQNTSGYYPSLRPNTTYFFNVRNEPHSTCSSDGNCQIYFQLHRPPGT